MAKRAKIFSHEGLKLKGRKALVVGSSKWSSGEGWATSLIPAEADTSGQTETPISRRPLVLISIVAVALFSLLAWQLFRLQIVNGQRYQGLAEGNRLRRKVTYAQRGRIVDRTGVVLADNQASFQLVATPYLLSRNAAERTDNYNFLAGHLKLSAEELARRVEARGLEHNQPLLIAENISYEKALIVEQKQPQLPGFSLDAVPNRQYKSDSGLGTVLGYVARADEADLKQNSKLFAVDFIGKDGIEAQHDDQLRGQNGVVETEVDSLGRPLRTITERPTTAGRDLQLSLNYGLQKELAAAIAEQMPKAQAKRAAGVAIDPRNGEVLAMVSLPSYDNNLFNGGIAADKYQQLLSDSLQPLHNKAIGGGYPSGSIIKPLHLAGALQSGVVNEHTTIVDRGKIVVPSEYDPAVQFTFNGWQLSGLGPMNARRALAMSSDIYFYTVGGGFQGFKGLGVERLTDYYRKFGLGSPTGIDLPGETAGRVPTPEWKKQTKGEDWFVGDTYNISIGQGDISTSPLQMAVAESAIVNGGKVLQPYMLKTSPQQQPKIIRENFIDPKHLQVVREGMKQVIGGTTSTATFAGVPVTVAGKSGTAETDPEAKKRSHAWYVAFAPYENPEVMFSVILEGGEGGSQFAAPAIARAMRWYYAAGKNTR